jgi:nitrogen fixation NifU-like protein
MDETYTERLLDHYRTPRHRGHLETPDLAAEEYNPLCGDRVTIEARVDAGRIAEVRWEGRGCAVCLGAASILAETIGGRSLEELRALGPKEFLVELQAKPRPSRLKCALLPWMAFRHAAYGEQEWPASGAGEIGHLR